jgi:hypothetical protein
MKNKLVMIIIAINIILNCNTVYSQTVETDINKTYKEFQALAYKINDPKDGYKYNNQSHKFIEYAIDIIKKSPSSTEAFYTLITFPGSLNFITNEPENIYQQLKEKYLNTLNDPDTNSAEKIVFMNLTLLYPTELDRSTDDEELKNKLDSCYNGLKKMANDSKNEAYRALATMVLASNIPEYWKKFVENFPVHPCISEIKLNLLHYENYTNNTNYEKTIEETNKLLNEYKEIILPDGWKFEISCYELIAVCYVKLKDFENARKYLNLIEKNASGDSQLHMLRELTIENTKSH